MNSAQPPGNALVARLPTSVFPDPEVADGLSWRVLLALAVVMVLLGTTGWGAAPARADTSTPLAAAERAWRGSTLLGRGLPDPGARPETIRRWFASLTARQRDTLASRHPLVVGNLAGAPVALRYRANRVALADARADARDSLREPGLSPQGRQETERRIHRFTSLLTPGRRILAFDPSGDGRVAEVLGDLRSARRVSVVVPGVDTDLLTFERTHRAWAAPAGMSRALQARQRAEAPGTRTATVAWADYTSPDGLGVDAAAGALAEEGAARLVRFVAGLPGRSEVGLFCHSYGSVVCGVAAHELPRRVTDLAVAGSPGMRAATVGGLRTRARVWAVRERDDWIADVPHVEFGGLGHGTDPVAPEFGARRVATDGAEGHTGGGHTGYFRPGSVSLANLAAIGAGARERVHCADAGCADDDRAPGA